jgi:hypothetical protein
MMTGWSSTKFLFFVADGKSKMASIFQISLPSDPMGMCWKIFTKTQFAIANSHEILT